MMQLFKTKRTIIKIHKDVITAAEAIKNLINEFNDNEYQTERISPINFKIIFPDGWVHVFWEKGCIYQEIFENSELSEGE